MIIATGSVDIDENKKLAEDAESNAKDAVNKSQKKYASMLSGKITQSTLPPTQAEDTNEHNDGDMWVVVDNADYTGVAQQMYLYKDGAWTLKQWDQQSLNVKALSALTANLGTVNSGTLNSVYLYAKNLTLDVNADGGSEDAGHNAVQWSGTVAEGMGVNFNHGVLHMNARHLSNGTYDATYIGPNDIKVRNTAGIDAGVGLNNRVDISDGAIIANTSWNDDTGIKIGMWLSGLLQGNYVRTNYVCGRDQSEVHFSNPSGHAVGIQVGTVKSNGHKIKSALSVKRDVTDYPPAEALAAIANTDIRRWRYRETDNSGVSHIGPVIDDVHAIGDKVTNIAHDMLSFDKDGGYYFNESNAVSILMAALKEANRKINDLSLRVTKLERGESM